MKKILYPAFVAVFLFACGPKQEKNTVVDNGPAMKARFAALIACFDTGKLDGIDTLLSAGSVDHSMDTSMHVPNGPAGLKQMISMWREGTPDLKTEIKQVVVEGDMLMAFGTMSGTNTGASMGMPPTNKAWSSDFCDVVKFDSDLKMTDHWGVFDEMKMMKDMGLIPSGPPTADAKKQKK